MGYKAPKAMSKAHKILAIDDQELILLSLQKRLTALGFDIRIANSGLKGLEVFKNFRPDVVLVDINMPDITGLEVAKKIRQSKYPNVHIVVVSGFIDETVLSVGNSLGIVDYIRKPLNLKEVEARVNCLLGTHPVTTSA